MGRLRDRGEREVGNRGMREGRKRKVGTEEKEM